MNIKSTEFIKWLPKIDKFWLGFILGIITPVITLVIVFFHTFSNYSVKEFFDFLQTMRILTKLFSLCVLPNLGVFFLFIWGDLLHGSRGVLAATFFVAIVILIIQFIF